MDCLIEFCSDSYQKRLRLLAQARSERYEETIENYKKMFIAHYEHVMKGCKDGKCKNSETCEYVYKTLKRIKIKQIEEFFEGLKNVYLQWINADCISSIQHFEKLLNKNKLLKDNVAFDVSSIYFKGRVSQEVLTSWDMFHIPFNKRYLISNQRYSLTGQPLIYIGSSILDVVEELEIKNIDELKVSVIQVPQEIKLYDLRNNIYEELNILQTELMLGKTDHRFGISFLYQMILASVCSFQKKQELRGYSFCEEYVLPQILAQIVKNNEYEGIVYYSTKRYDDIKVETNDLSYKENIALFTQNNAAHVYDRVLYDKLNISVPIDKKKIEKISVKDIEDVKNEIGKTRQQEKIVKAEKLVSSFNRVYGGLKVNDEEYIDTDMGQLHMYHLFAVLNQVLV